LTYFGFLLLLLFVIYNSNFRTISTFDTFPARLLPFSLLLDHSLYLDQWIEPYHARSPGEDFYFVVNSHGHWMSMYPIITPVVVTPLYVLPAWWLSRQLPPLYPYSFDFVVIANTMEKLSASLIAAMSGAVLFLAFRKIASRNVSLAVALIYGLASNTWAISSQALWRQGLTELSFAFLLWALFRVPGSTSAPFWAGLALAVATANKPLEAILIMPFLLYFGCGQWKKLLLFLTPLAALGSLVLAYNLYFFARLLGGFGVRTLGMGGSGRITLLAPLAVGLPGSLVGAYPAPPLAAGGSGHITRLARIGVGLAGSLVSPSRGLLVYSPWVAFAFWGAARLWKEKSFAWSRPLIVALAAMFMVQVGWQEWWGGWCFGPRYLTELLPFFAWFLVPVWASIRARPVLRVAFAATVAIALWVQVVGAFYYTVGNWDRRPVNVPFEQRAWDWSDNQLLSNWKAGPAQPLLLKEWERLLQPRSGVPQP
jgi:hypothetical protein